MSVNLANKPSFSDTIGREEEEANEPELEAELKMFGEEQKQMGKLSWAVYRSYWRAVGGCIAVAVLLSLFLMQGIKNCVNISCMYYKISLRHYNNCLDLFYTASKNVSDWWLSHWISHLKDNTTELVSLSADPLLMLTFLSPERLM